MNDVKTRNTEENLTKSKSLNNLKTTSQIKKNDLEFTLGSGMNHVNDKSFSSNYNNYSNQIENVKNVNQSKIDLNIILGRDESPSNLNKLGSPGKYSMNFISTINKNRKNSHFELENANIKKSLK